MVYAVAYLRSDFSKFKCQLSSVITILNEGSLLMDADKYFPFVMDDLTPDMHVSVRIFHS